MFSEGAAGGAEPPEHNRPEPTVLADWLQEYTGIMGDDPVSPPAPDQTTSQPSDSAIVSVEASAQAETASDVPVPASESASSQPEASASVVQPQNPPSPEPASDQQAPSQIPAFHYPFYGSYPISFDFGAVSDDESIKKKYQEWGILGHDGVDFALPEGTEVLSCDDGIMTQAGDNGDFGISVTVKHSWGTSIYCHLQSFGVLVNDQVSKAQVIGLSDHTGFVTGPHLHFGIQPNDVNVNNGYLGYINPNPYLSETSDKPQVQPEPNVQPQPINPPIPSDVPVSPVSPQSPQIPQQEIEKQATAMFEARVKENSFKGNQVKKEKHGVALQKIFSFAQEKKKVTNEQIRDLLHISQSSATNYLSELVQRGMLKIEGKGKATVYLY